jgi:cobalt-zinc-cadmium efflux system outer membrane protein
MKRLLLAAPLVSIAFAQPTLTLKEAVTRALAAHPLLAASEQRVAAFEGLRRQAGFRPNPAFSFQTENVRFDGSPPFRYWSSTDTYALVSQTFETAGKRERRVEAAGAGVRRAELERELLRRQIAGRVKQAYWAAAGGLRIHELLMETSKNFALTVDYHEARVREGAMAEADLLRVQLESERIALAATGALLEAERARIALFREMGESTIPAAVRFEPIELDQAAAVQPDVKAALERRVEVRLARAALEQAEANYRLQLASSRPDVTGLAGYKRTEGLDTLVAGFSLNLPLRNRNQGNIAAAAAEVSAARAELAAAQALVRAEVEAAARDYAIRRRQLAESLRPMRDQAAESARIAQAAYREGGWDLLRLLDAERLRLETELVYYRALAELRQSAAALETAMGVEP